MNSRAVLLTGATGFLGRHLLQALDPQQPVYALVRRASEWNALDYAASHPNVVPLEGDLVGSDAWTHDPRLEQLGGVLHSAAVVHHSRRGHAAADEINIEGTKRLVRVAGRGQAPMIFVSTSGTVACSRNPGGALPDEEAPYVDAVVGSWPYYASKIRAELEGLALARELGVPFSAVRPPIMLGPGDHRFRSTGLIIRYMRRKLPFLIRGGMSFCDVRDAASAMVKALPLAGRHSAYHLPGHDVTVDGFFALCEAICGIPRPRHFMPYPVAHGLASGLDLAAHLVGKHSPMPDPVVIEMGRHHWGIASRHSQAELGYHTRPATETIADTIHWLQAHHPLLGSGAGG